MKFNISNNVSVINCFGQANVGYIPLKSSAILTKAYSIVVSNAARTDAMGVRHRSWRWCC